MNKEEIANKCIKLAKLTKKNEDVPVGCVIVKNDKIISTGYNKKNKKKNSLYHAEIIAIHKACKKLKDWRLTGCDIYVTLYPCNMCAAAIVSSRIANVYYMLKDDKENKYNLNLLANNNLNFKTNSIFMEEYEQEAKKLLQDFFINLRNKKK